jgi:hypothetical protein
MDIGDRLATDDSGLECLKQRTIRDACSGLAKLGRAEWTGGLGGAYRWRIVPEGAGTSSAISGEVGTPACATFEPGTPLDDEDDERAF